LLLADPHQRAVDAGAGQHPGPRSQTLDRFPLLRLPLALGSDDQEVERAEHQHDHPDRCHQVGIHEGGSAPIPCRRQVLTGGVYPTGTRTTIQPNSVSPAVVRGGASPRCRHASSVATRPRGVRIRKPCRTRNGSATSSTVSDSSPTEMASVDNPTGPPANRLHTACSTDRSSRSRPTSSTSYSSSACRAAVRVSRPSPWICA